MVAGGPETRGRLRGQILVHNCVGGRVVQRGFEKTGGVGGGELDVELGILLFRILDASSSGAGD